MDEVGDDHRRRVEDARLRTLSAMIGERVVELAILLSAFKAVAESGPLEQQDVPRSELFAIPDPFTILTDEEKMTTLEAVNVLRDWLGMSEEGEARLWRLLGAGTPDLFEE
jgi:hypothetical protein